jgi:superfamily II RNA helicase
MQYDPFQQKAIDYINEGHSVIVSAPTGAGKTAIAEHVINDCLIKGTKAIYTAPIKALSNQKFRDFQETFPDRIGILTGDVSINPNAPILIMTTEIFRNKILGEPKSLEDYSWIIFDEIHYLDNYERGTVWEESLIFLPQHMNMLALSATIPNIDEFARWIHSIHKRPLKVVKEDKRPVPLHFLYHCQGEIVDSITDVRKLTRSDERRYYGRYRPRGRVEHHKQNRLSTMIEHLSENERLPAIYFAFGRRRCEYLADEMQRYDFLNDAEKREITGLYDTLCRKFDLEGEKSAEIMRPLIKRGIAFHHAGMLPTLKEVIERLFTSRLLKVIFTTETFALGINMPARTVVFDELRKFYGSFFANLKTRDFYQMAGRAGRRGIDEEGFVYMRVNPHQLPCQELQRIIYGQPETVRSRFNASYATLLNLYQKYGDGLYDIYPLSFHFFQEREKKQKKAIEALRSKVALLEELGYISRDGLTPKGDFASKVYGYELPLAELYEQGTLEDLSEIELGILAAALVFEPRKSTVMPKLSKRARRLEHVTDMLSANISRLERKSGVPTPSKGYHYHLSACVEMWMEGKDFDKIFSETDADEGEIIRYFRMAIQILHEILDTHLSEHLKAKIKKAISLMNRDVIDAEKQLRA